MSGSEGCVEVAAAARSILVRDSKDPHGPTLTFSGPEWARFVARLDKWRRLPIAVMVSRGAGRCRGRR
ncbi:MAG TPA: DUF397 domain-containing protein, partial [Streptosporangiaceae bacterium]|nr:DUF397 domain-containing protein [Streptosporangiaceae bacterium]